MPEARQSTPMRSITGALLAIALFATATAGAQDRYIDDVVMVPLREGAGMERRVIHPGIAGGTAVVLVQENKETGWAFVRLRDNTEGWLPARYLKREPGARWQIGNALRMLGAPDDGSVTLPAAIEQSKADTAAIATERDKLQAELAEGRQLWSHADEMDAANRALTEQVQQLKGQIDVLETERRRLQDDNWKKWFINGVWATGMGGVLTLLLPRILQRRRRYSEWS
jgi:SH3 domain protein